MELPGVWNEMQTALGELAAHGVERLDSLGVDAWGVDYALLGERGALLENPYHYRDSRTDGVMDAVLRRIPAEFIYDVTGIQFMPINTLYQLYAACQRTPKLLDTAERLLTIPDLLNFWLAGTAVCEYTNATTTQFLDRRSIGWSRVLLDRLSIPTRPLAPLVKPGTELGGLVPDLARLPGLGGRRSSRRPATIPDRRWPRCARRVPPPSAARAPGRCWAPKSARQWPAPRPCA